MWIQERCNIKPKEFFYKIYCMQINASNDANDLMLTNSAIMLLQTDEL